MMQRILLWENMEQVAHAMDSKVFRYIGEGQAVSFESFERFDLLAFDWYDVDGRCSDSEKVTVYLDAEDIFFFCEGDASCDYVQSVADRLTEEGAITNEQLLYRFFLRLFHGDMDYLDQLENAITDSETQLLSGKSRAALVQIVLWRRELLRLKRYYEQLDAIFDEMTLNDNELLGEECLRRMAILGRRTDRFLSKVAALQEMVSQLREAYQSQLSIQQNDLMKVFTVVTVIFLPLTLLTGWFGMNFVHMPELQLSWAYPVLIGICIAIVVGLLWFFRHKKWL